MSLNTVIAFALLLKKITKKRALASKKKKRNTNDSSESEEEEFSQISEIIEESKEKRKSVPSTKTSSILSITTSITQHQKSIVNMNPSSLEKLQSKVSELDLKQQLSHDVVIRDFAYPTDSPLHYGQSIILNNISAISLSHPDFNGRDARALFDFTPETEYEIGFKAGQIIWVQHRHCSGWLIADVNDETGLVPESYVEFI